MTKRRSDGSERREDDAERVTFWSIAFSTIAAAFGVQSRRNRERDFQHGRPGAFIAAGVLFTLGFVLLLLLVVYLVIGRLVS